MGHTEGALPLPCPNPLGFALYPASRPPKLYISGNPKEQRARYAGAWVTQS